MNAIRQLAVEQFQSKSFLDTSPDYFEVTCSHSIDSGPETLVNKQLSLSEIRSLSKEAPTSFLMVKIFFRPPFLRDSFDISIEDCYSLLEIFNIDRSGLGLVADSTTGFHLLGNNSFYFQGDAYRLLWSYDSHRHITRALTFVYNSENAQKGYKAFYKILKSQEELIRHPFYLPLSALVEATGFIGRLLLVQYEKCRRIESNTGYHPWRMDFRTPDAVREFGAMSREMTAVVVHVELAAARLQQNSLATEKLIELSNEHVLPKSSEIDRSSVQDALNLLLSKMRVMVIDFNYIKTRATSQINAISQAMTREDAMASITLAERASQDSSSMKVIAIMTMVFLPGTFFAALFAVPSLKWDAESVIQGNFWVYWAFTIPCTLLVVLLWFVPTHAIGLLSKFFRRSQPDPKETMSAAMPDAPMPGRPVENARVSIRGVAQARPSLSKV